MSGIPPPLEAIRTDRLVLRRVDVKGDADFILELVNEPLWKRFIADMHVTTVDAAETYLRTGTQLADTSYVVTAAPHVPMDGDRRLGICGFMKRDFLPHMDMGFAFLERHHGAGYALEAGKAVLGTVADDAPVLAFVHPDNAASLRLLDKLGFVDNGTVLTPSGESVLYARAGTAAVTRPPVAPP